MKDRLQPPTSFSRARRAVLPALGLLILGGSADCTPNRNIPTPPAITRPDTTPVGPRPLNTPIVKIGPEVKRPATATPDTRKDASSATLARIKEYQASRGIAYSSEESQIWANLQKSYDNTLPSTDINALSNIRLNQQLDGMSQSANPYYKKGAENRTIFTLSDTLSNPTAYSQIGIFPQADKPPLVAVIVSRINLLNKPDAKLVANAFARDAARYEYLIRAQKNLQNLPPALQTQQLISIARGENDFAIRLEMDIQLLITQSGIEGIELGDVDELFPDIKGYLDCTEQPDPATCWINYIHAISQPPPPLPRSTN